MSRASSSQQKLEKAVALHRQGELEAALALYRSVTQSDPRHAAAFNLYGLTSFQLGNTDQAIASIKQALALNPALPGADYNLGMMLQSQQRHAEAERHYRRALTLNPSDFQALTNLGVVLRALKRYPEALDVHQRALSIRRTPAEHCNLAMTLADLERHEEAVAQFRLALAEKPDFFKALVNCGQSLLTLARASEARVLIEKAASLNLIDANELRHLGNSFILLDLPHEAIRCFERSNAIAQSPKTYALLALAWHLLGREGDAIGAFDRAIALDPDDDIVKCDKGIALLANGRFAEGFGLIEHRWTNRPAGEFRNYPAPRWSGERVAGSLLIWGDQGVGDQILYASLLNEAAARADKLVLEVEPRLVPLFARSFPNVQVIPKSQELFAGPVAAHEALGSLARHLRRDWADFPISPRPSLVADEARTRGLRDRLHDGRTVIGLSWRSITGKPNKKSAPLREFGRIFSLPNCRFVDLQYGNTEMDRRAVEKEFGIRIDRVEDVDNMNDLDGLAALISACDFVVTISNTTAHVAGAAGAPTFVMVPYGTDRFWYWFRGRSDNPWYPRLTVMQQAAGQTWSELIGQIAETIEARRKTSSP